nr:hypothetical protein Itr_chr08CG00550 [Ipomoea trifida]
MKSYQRPKKNSSTHWSLYDDAFSFLRSPVARVSGEPVNWGFSVREKRKKCEAELSEIEKRN